MAGNEPVYDLEDFDVIASATDFAPEFSRAVPSFSFYETPDLPNGELILALFFVDRYRETPVPGAVKWAGILHFPVLDGYDRVYLKWICLYAYDDRLFGYDPSAFTESQRRFAVPIRFEDRLNPRVLARFAHRFVDTVFAADSEDWIADDFDDFDDDAAGGGGWSGGMDIPAGRIAPVYASQRGTPPDELVRLVFQYIEDPNPHPSAEAAIGGMHQRTRRPISLRSLLAELASAPDHLATASELLSPRWNQRVVFHHTQRPFFFVRKEQAEEVLLFNVSTRVFAYHPEFGVWRTDATVFDLTRPQDFLSKLKVPGIRHVNRVEFAPVTRTDE